MLLLILLFLFSTISSIKILNFFFPCLNLPLFLLFGEYTYMCVSEISIMKVENFHGTKGLHWSFRVCRGGFWMLMKDKRDLI